MSRISIRRTTSSIKVDGACVIWYATYGAPIWSAFYGIRSRTTMRIYTRLDVRRFISAIMSAIRNDANIDGVLTTT